MKTIGLVAFTFGLLALFTITAGAQERIRTIQMTNTAFGTSYYLQGGSNVLSGPGLISYQGGTNNQTGNMMAGMTVSNNWQGNTGVPFSLVDLQTVQVLWTIWSHSITNSTYPIASVASNETYTLDLSPVPDGSIWISNAVSQTVTQNSTLTNQATVMFPAINGTNAFTGYYWARWSGFNTSATNPVVTDKNQLNFFR